MTDRNSPGVVVLISGRGSNMQALVEAGIPVRAVLSNRADAAGLAWAAARGLATEVLSHRDYPSRVAFDQAMAARIDAYAPQLVILAGFMRILSPWFVEHYTGRLLNIHPSLLPSFTGLDTHQRALQAGVRLHGCSVHLVTAELDAGPILAQAAVPVLPEDDEASLAARVLRQEHRLYPRTVQAMLQGQLFWDGHRVQGGSFDAQACLLNPPLA